MANRYPRVPSPRMPGHPAYQPLPSNVEEDHPLIDPSRPGAANLPPRHRVAVGPYSTQHQLVTGKSTFAPSIIPAVNHQPRNEDIVPMQHPYEGYKYERERLETFSDWPSNTFVTKEDLARNGFIYTHTSDRVQCVFCRGVLSSWENGDVVEDEHKRNCPECAFAHGVNSCGNVPLNPTPQHTTIVSTNVGLPSYNTTVNIPVAAQNVSQHVIHVTPHNNNSMLPSETLPALNGFTNLSLETHSGPAVSPSNRFDANGIIDVPLPSLSSGPPSNCVPTAEPKYRDWADERLRVQSFVGWPSQMSQAPIDLAKAGLLYMGFGDRCKCFWCGGELYDWEPSDIPIEEHAKWFSHCNFVRQLKGNGYIQYVKDKQNGLIVEDEDIMKKPHVLAVLQEGYTADQVKEVLKHYGPSRVYDATVLRKAIEDLRLERQSFLNRARGNVEPVAYDDIEMEERPEAAKDFPGTVRTTEPTSSSSDRQPESSAREPDTKSGSVSKPSDSCPSTTGSNASESSKPEGVEGVLKENEQLRDQRLCKICLDKELCIVFLPCGHLATCEECSQTMYECPICRRGITDKVKTYWS